MSTILCFIKTAIFLSIFLQTLSFSGAANVNSTSSKLLTTLKVGATPDTTPANHPTNPQTVSSIANTDFRTSQTTQSSMSSVTAETFTSTATMADNIIATTTTKHQPQPSVRRIPSRLEEKLESLSCDIPPLPTESRLWRGNETHELMLPITVSKPKLDATSLYPGLHDVNTVRWRPDSDVLELRQISVNVPRSF
jgi:hypothetical protein